ncbi:MAG TPA: hypothetical protein VF597_03555 [Candidatus Saccharimonadales bacterium]|jgi:hypothetical protein
MKEPANWDGFSQSIKKVLRPVVTVTYAGTQRVKGDEVFLADVSSIDVSDGMKRRIAQELLRQSLTNKPGSRPERPVILGKLVRVEPQALPAHCPICQRSWSECARPHLHRGTATNRGIWHG